MADASSGASSGKVPVVECAVVAWRFFLEHWQRFLPAAVIVALVSGIAPALLVAGQPAALGDLFVMAISTIAGIFFVAAVLRQAVRGEFQGPAGLAFGLDETRLFGVLGAMALLVVPPILLFSVVVFVVLLGRMGGSPEELEALAADPEAFNRALNEALATPAGMVIQVIGLVMIGVLLVVSARLIMVNAAAIGERRIVFFQTWSWSKGNVLRIIAAMILTALPVALFNLVVGSILSSAVELQAGVVAIVREIVIALIGALGLIPQIALGAHLYKGLRPPGFVAK
jgi:hypothetical protein